MFITMIREQGTPYRVVMAVKPGGPTRQFIAGHVHELPDDEAELLLTGEIGLHDCIVGGRRRIFEMSRPGALAGIAPQQDSAMAAQRQLIDALVEDGSLSPETARTLKAQLPPSATSPQQPYITRCESCRERVRVLPNVEECPNCRQALRRPPEADNSVPTAALASPDGDALLAEDSVFECQQCGFRPGTSGDPSKDAKRLQQHMKTHAKGDAKDDLP
jgi:hypothetical protein